MLRTLATFLIAFCLAGLLIAEDEPKAPPKENPPQRQVMGWWSNETSQFLFFATIEGLYEDGVSQEIIDIILPPVRLNQPQKRSYTPPTEGGRIVRNTNAHFVYTCPMCHPVSEAFRLYADRQPFIGQKDSDVDTFNTRGLPEDLLKRIRSKDRIERITALRDLINRWTARRLDRMRLTAEERAQWELRIKGLRDEGTRALKTFQAGGNGEHFQKLYADWKFCPSCDGGLDACKIKPQH